MEPFILIILLILVFIIIFPITQVIKSWSKYEDKLINNTFQRFIKDEKKAKLAYWIFRIFLAILIILLFLFLINLTNQEDQSNEKPETTIQGFGGENVTPNIGGMKPTEEEIAEDAKNIVPSADGEPIKTLYLINPDSSIQFLENPRRYKYSTTDSNKYVEIFIESDIENYTLKTSDGKVDEKPAITGAWDSTEQYFIFTKPEKFEDDLVNKNNLWILKFGEAQTKQIYNTEDFNRVTAISNGEKIAFATKNKIGMMNLDGSDLKYIYEFQEFDSRSEEIYVPVIKIIDKNSFSVNIKLPTYFVDGAEEDIKFSFEGERL